MKEITNKELGRRLKIVREELGFTQAFVSEQTGIFQAIISSIESGTKFSKSLFTLLAFYSDYVYLNYLFTEDFRMVRIDNLQKKNLGGFVQQILDEGLKAYREDLKAADEKLSAYLKKADDLLTEF